MAGTSGDSSKSSGPHLWKITAVRDALGMLLVMGFIWLGYYLRGIVVPVLIALALAYAFYPLIHWAHRRLKLPRMATAGILFLMLAAGGAAVIYRLGPLLINQMVTLAKKTPEYISTLAQRHDIKLGTVSEQLVSLAQRVQEDPLQILQTVFAGTGQVFGFIGGVIGTTTYVLISVILVSVLFLVFAGRFPDILTQAQSYIPASRKERTLQLVEKMDRAVGGFLRARLISSLVVGILLSVGWALAGVPYWFLLGMGSGLLNLIPYAGVIGWPVAVLVKYLDMTAGSDAPGFDWMSVMIWPSLVFGVAQFLDGWVLLPLIGGKSTNLSAVTILLVVFIGGAIAGIYGILLAVPAAACLKILFEEAVLPRLKQWAADH